MNLRVHILLLTVLSLLHTVTGRITNENAKENSTKVIERSKENILLRRKRFLVFPEGSSFQLVFCLQASALIPIGNIFLYGNTAALAWTLPMDPKFLYMFKDRGGDAQRRGDLHKNVYYLDEKGKLVAKIPYKRKSIINPAFAKRNVDDDNKSFKEKLKIRIEEMKSGHTREHTMFLKHHRSKHSIHFHRSSRVELYEKMEKLLTLVGRDGRRCILYKLCESAQPASRATFLQELLRVVFTLPKGQEFDGQERKEYDTAHTPGADCAGLYPGCERFPIPEQIKIF